MPSAAVAAVPTTWIPPSSSSSRPRLSANIRWSSMMTTLISGSAVVTDDLTDRAEQHLLGHRLRQQPALQRCMLLGVVTGEEQHGQARVAFVQLHGQLVAAHPR